MQFLKFGSSDVRDGGKDEHAIEHQRGNRWREEFRLVRQLRRFWRDLCGIAKFLHEQVCY